MSDDGQIHTVAASERDPRSGATFIVLGVGVILTFVIGVLLEVLYHRTVDSEFQRKVVNVESVELLKLEAEQRDQLANYAKIPEDASAVRIPIQRAMRLVVEESRGSEQPR